jgi:hypothetical protein
MSYSICGLVVPEREAAVCAENKWPCVTLAGGVRLIPLERDFLLLAAGDETEPCEHLDFVVPEWMAQMLSRFTTAAYVEAEFWGGTGMQASFVWEDGKMAFGPEVASGAINAALRRLGVQDESRGVFYGLPLIPGKEPFDMIGLGRHRSVGGWLQECAKSG